MLRIYGCAFSILLSSIVLGEETLLGNLETEGKQNNIGMDWYYFSDVKDGGSSVIKDVQYMGEGAYEDFSPSIPGYESEHCAKVEFVLGDNQPRNNNNDEYDPFVGIGMDISQPGTTVDISSAEEISFYARGTQSLGYFVEIVTEDVYDYLYLRKDFEVTDQWEKITISLKDLKYANIPTDQDEIRSSLSVAQKINWQVVHGYSAPDSGYLEIDQVTISSYPTNIKARLTVVPKPQSIPNVGYYLINGRKLGGLSRKLPKAPIIQMSNNGQRVFSRLPGR